MIHSRPSSQKTHPLTQMVLTRFMLLLTVFLLAPDSWLLSPAFGQNASATLSGTVVDPNGAVVPGANITITETATGLQRTATTDEQGYFSIPLLKPSAYTLLVAHDGFTTAEVRDIVLNINDERALRIPLKTGDIRETVNVTGEAPLINESPSVGTVVDRQFVSNIPLNGRSFQSLITLTPGVSLFASPNAVGYDGQFSVNGQRASANGFTVDGVSANFGSSPGSQPGSQTSGNLPALTAFGTTQSLVSVDALQEFRVLTSTYAAEYGRQPGGQISIATRSGTNEFHGSLFDYVRNDKFDANDWFANRAGAARPPERQNDFGGTLSGPVLLPQFGEGGHQPWYNGRNRTFFFFSYEGLRLRIPKFAVTNVPTLCLRGQVSACLVGANPALVGPAPAAIQPILQAFPLPNGRNLVIPVGQPNAGQSNGLAELSTSYSDPSTLNAASIRVDHSISNKHFLFGRYNEAPSEGQTRSTRSASVLNISRISTRTFTLGLTSSFTSRLINDFRINFSNNNTITRVEQIAFGGAVPVNRNVFIPSQYDAPSALGSVALSFPGRTSASSPSVSFRDKSDFSQQQFNMIDNISYAWGSHQLKSGIDFRRLTPTFAVNAYSASLTFTSAERLISSIVGTTFIGSTFAVKPIYTNVSAYGQDTWRVSRRFTLDLGLRWDVNPAPGEANGKLPYAVDQITNFSTMTLLPRGPKLWKTTYNNFAPRFGLAYQLSNKQGRETIVRGGFGVFYDTGNDFSSGQFFTYPFDLSNRLTNATFPFTAAQVTPPQAIAAQSTLTPPFSTTYIFDPDLKLPYTLQWNLAVERSLGKSQTFTVSYVGAAGRRLLQQQLLFGPPIRPHFSLAAILTTNKATSDYDALQAQFQRRLSRGLQALASYTWSHAMDDDSTSSTQRVAQRGNADFDVRHSFASAVTYDIPFPKGRNIASWIFSRWAVDSSVHAQSAFPVDIVANMIFGPTDGSLIFIRPNLITGVPVYVDDSSVPGGRKVNRAAFSIPAGTQQGTLGRNVIRGLPVWQADVALRRQFRMSERSSLQLRGEAFNIFNHPNFGAIQTDLSASNFGEAINMLNRQLGGISQLYQLGGPRSLQFAAKFQF